MKPCCCTFAVGLLALAACSAPAGIPHPAPVPRHAPAVQVLVLDRPERTDSMAGRQAGATDSVTAPAAGAAAGVSARPMVGRISGQLPEVVEPQPAPQPREQARQQAPAADSFGETDWPERRVVTSQFHHGGFVFSPLSIGLGVAIAHGFHRGAGRWLFRGPARALRGAARWFR
jgi:hypothetical protein